MGRNGPYTTRAPENRTTWKRTFANLGCLARYLCQIDRADVKKDIEGEKITEICLLCTVTVYKTHGNHRSTGPVAHMRPSILNIQE